LLPIKRNRFARSRGPAREIHLPQTSEKFVRALRQNRKRFVVLRDRQLCSDILRRLESVGNFHSEVATNVEDGQVGMKLGSNELDVRKLSGVSAVVNRRAILDLNDITDGYASIDRWRACFIAVWYFETAGMYRLNEGNLHLAISDGDLASWIPHNVESSLSRRKLRDLNHCLC
jgi:hypothetical protein